jgi:hypothetical protein
MEISIDPSNITQDSIPVVLGAILVQLDQNSKDHEEIKKMLKEHEDCLQILNFSRCKLIPWLGRNRYVVTSIFVVLSIWISSLDWINRYLQWAFFPPRPGP